MAESFASEAALSLMNPMFLSCDELSHELFIRGIDCDEENISSASELVEAFHLWKSEAISPESLALLDVNLEFKSVASKAKILQSQTNEILEEWSEDEPAEVDLQLSRFIHCVLRVQRSLLNPAAIFKFRRLALKLNELREVLQKLSAVEDLPAVTIPICPSGEGDGESQEDSVSSSDPEDGSDSCEDFSGLEQSSASSDEN